MSLISKFQTLSQQNSIDKQSSNTVRTLTWNCRLSGFRGPEVIHEILQDRASLWTLETAMWRILCRHDILHIEQHSHNSRSHVTWSRRWARCTLSCCPRRTCCPRSPSGRSACPPSTASGAIRYNSLKHQHQATSELTEHWVLTIPDVAGVYQQAERGARGR